MPDTPFESALHARIDELRESIEDLRSQLSNYTLLRIRDYAADLNTAEKSLDTAEMALANKSADYLEAARCEIQKARVDVDRTCGFISNIVVTNEVLVGLWALVVMLWAGWHTYLVWSMPDLHEFHVHVAIFNMLFETRPFQHVSPTQLPTVRLVLLILFGGMVGAGVNLGRVLLVAIPNRTLDPRDVIWYYLSPFFSSALAISFFAIIRAGFSGLGGTASSGATSTASAFAVGFLVGFVPKTVYYRLTAVVRAFFGTDDVKAPKISSPEVQCEKGRFKVGATVTPSSATRVTSVTAVVRTADGHTSSVRMKEATNSLWNGDFSPPEGLPTTPPTGASLHVEAQDETGNTGKSEIVTLPPCPAPPVEQNSVQSDPGRETQ